MQKALKICAVIKSVQIPCHVQIPFIINNAFPGYRISEYVDIIIFFLLKFYPEGGVYSFIAVEGLFGKAWFTLTANKLYLQLLKIFTNLIPHEDNSLAIRSNT